MLKEILAKQFRKPSGILGFISSGFMKKNNQPCINKVCDMLDVNDSDQILEIGCGEGFALKNITERNSCCTIDATDFSEFMLRKAKKLNKSMIQNKRINLYNKDIINFDKSDKKYTKIFAINVIYFWSELAPYFKKIASLLIDNGRFVFYMSSPERLKAIPFAVDSVFNKYAIDNVIGELKKNGFAEVTYETVKRDELDSYFVTAFKQG